MITTNYPEVDQLVAQLSSMIHHALGQNLKGLYLFGSLVGGDFKMHTSDIDLVAITENIVSELQLKSLKKVHQTFIEKHPEWNDRIEVAYVSVDGMKHFKSRTNRIARISPGEPLHYRDMDINWLMDWHMVQDQGLTIIGLPPERYIPLITAKEFVQSIRAVLPQFKQAAKEARHKGYQSYVVLSLCRNLYALQHGRQISKYGGAHWASQKYPQWASFIKEALAWHGYADTSDSLDTQKQTMKFADFIFAQVDSI